MRRLGDIVESNVQRKKLACRDLYSNIDATSLTKSIHFIDPPMGQRPSEITYHQFL